MCTWIISSFLPLFHWLRKAQVTGTHKVMDYTGVDRKKWGGGHLRILCINVYINLLFLFCLYFVIQQIWIFIFWECRTPYSQLVISWQLIFKLWLTTPSMNSIPFIGEWENLLLAKFPWHPWKGFLRITQFCENALFMQINKISFIFCCWQCHIF